MCSNLFQIVDLFQMGQVEENQTTQVLLTSGDSKGHFALLGYVSLDVSKK